MKILDMPCTKGFMQLAQDGVDKGWHEMNGGNLSYRLTEAEAANVKKVQKKAAGGWQEICESVPKLAGAFFMVTRTTGYMRNVMRDPVHAFGIVEIDLQFPNRFTTAVAALSPAFTWNTFTPASSAT